MEICGLEEQLLKFQSIIRYSLSAHAQEISLRLSDQYSIVPRQKKLLKFSQEVDCLNWIELVDDD